MAGTRLTWQPEHDQALTALHESGKTLGQCAELMGFPKSSVARHAKTLGLDWDRSKTENATIAKTADNRARRAAIVARLYTRAERVLARLEGDDAFATIMRGSEGREVERTLDFVPSRDEREMSSALATHLQAAAKLEQIDADGGARDAASMLDRLAKSLGVTGPDQ